MPEELNPAAKALIDKMRAEEARKLLEQKRAEQRLIEQKKAEKKSKKEPEPQETETEPIQPVPVSPKPSQGVTEPATSEPMPAESVSSDTPKEPAPSEDKPAKKQTFNFLYPLLENNIRVHMVMDPVPIEGILTAYSQYEMKLNTPSGRRILMKHAVSYIEILEQTPD
jgi:sRNA-binding regulator protein Hfq